MHRRECHATERTMAAKTIGTARIPADLGAKYSRIRPDCFGKTTVEAAPRFPRPGERDRNV